MDQIDIDQQERLTKLRLQIEMATEERVRRELSRQARHDHACHEIDRIWRHMYLEAYILLTCLRIMMFRVLPSILEREWQEPDREMNERSESQLMSILAFKNCRCLGPISILINCIYLLTVHAVPLTHLNQGARVHQRSCCCTGAWTQTSFSGSDFT